jgi:hypothetical protein
MTNFISNLRLVSDFIWLLPISFANKPITK